MKKDEVLELCIEEMNEVARHALPEFIGIQQVEVEV